VEIVAVSSGQSETCHKQVDKLVLLAHLQSPSSTLHARWYTIRCL